MPPPAEHRAEAVRPPEPTRAVKEARLQNKAFRRSREALERRSVLRGSILLAIVAMVVSMARAGWDRVFIFGWWRQW